jgi:hypothetical protein
LGDPLAEKGSIGSKTRRLRHYLKKLKVELLILDEFQHFIDKDSLKVLKTLSDWLKLLIDMTGIPIMLMGMPYCHFILDTRGNEQLKRRFSIRKKLEPFTWGAKKEQRRDFRKFLNLVDLDLPFNKRSNLAALTTAFCIYYATNGIPYYVMDLIRRASFLAIKRGMDCVSTDLLAEAYDESMALAYPDRVNPFCSDIPLEIKPFKDDMPNLRSLAELKDRRETASDIFQR